MGKTIHARSRLARYLAIGLLGATTVVGTIVASIPSALAAPATPSFGSAIDAYASYDGQDTCDPTDKPGPRGVRDLLNATYGQHSSGISRACNSSEVSEHEEGRALDYMLNVNNAKQRAVATDITTWLLATDRHGNRHANARRLGVMYMIWNRRIWSAARASEGWRRYSGASAHTDHIHISLSWAGARRQTTWWTAALDNPADLTGDGRLDLAMRHSNGDLLLYANTGAVSENSGTLRSAVKVGHGWTGFTEIGLADFTGDGYADVVGRHGNGDLMLYRHSGDLNGERTLKGAMKIGHGWTGFAEIDLGDVDGDGWSDVVGRHRNGDLMLYRHSGEVSGEQTLKGGVKFGHGWSGFTGIAVADANNDGRDDVLGVTTGGDLMLYASAGTSLRSGVKIGHGWSGLRLVTAGDLTGDGYADLLAVTPGGDLLLYRGTNGSPRSALKIGHGWTGAAEIAI